jgi:hypothetical protein
MTVFPQLLHPHTTLQMVYLGCVVLREAVTLDDLLSWALDGQLPYLDAPHVISKVMPGASVVDGWGCEWPSVWTLDTPTPHGCLPILSFVLMPPLPRCLPACPPPRQQRTT